MGIRRGGFGGSLDRAVDGVCAGDTCGGGESGQESAVGVSKLSKATINQFADFSR